MATMKTYTFAEADAPVEEHMAALVQYLNKRISQERFNATQALRKRDTAFIEAKIAGIREVIEIIEDSNSI